jgi:hypothetical protein
MLKLSRRGCNWIGIDDTEIASILTGTAAFLQRLSELKCELGSTCSAYVSLSVNSDFSSVRRETQVEAPNVTCYAAAVSRLPQKKLLSRLPFLPKKPALDLEASLNARHSSTTQGQRITTSQAQSSSSPRHFTPTQQQRVAKSQPQLSPNHAGAGRPTAGADRAHIHRRRGSRL